QAKATTNVEKMMDNVQKTSSLIASTIFSTLVVAFACGEIFISIILPARTFAGKYKEMCVDTKNISSCVEEVGIVGINLNLVGIIFLYVLVSYNNSSGKFT